MADAGTRTTCQVAGDPLPLLREPRAFQPGPPARGLLPVNHGLCSIPLNPFDLCRFPEFRRIFQRGVASRSGDALSRARQGLPGHANGATTQKYYLATTEDDVTAARKAASEAIADITIASELADGRNSDA
jgi:hypothetical protein